MRKKYFVLLVLAAVALIYFIVRPLFVHEKVVLTKVERGNIITVVYATGVVTADTMAVLRSENGGIAVYVGAREGMNVKKGMTLLRTDQSDYILQVEQATADMQSARIDLQNKEQNLERIKKLFQTSSVTEKALEDAQRDADLARIILKQRQISLDLAKERLTKTEVTAPFDGVITSSKVKRGDFVLPNGECFQIVSPTSLLVQADVDEQDFSRIKIHQKCVVAFDAFGSEKFDGTVYRVVPKTDESTKTAKVFIRLATIPANLTVGMTATVNIVTGEISNVVIVPRSSVYQNGSEAYVFVVEEGKAKRVQVAIGTSDGRSVEILNADSLVGKQIILQPNADLKDNTRVNVVGS
ncbi:MAG: efflux RND transporter periplasmic adaptor subunit [Candidatus Kryptoniota bacterium]